MNFNPYSRSHLGNPHPVYAALREDHPIHLNDRPRFWAISRHDDVDRALHDWETYSSSGGITLDGFTGVKPMIILMDPPRQTQLRRVMQKAFVPTKMNANADMIRGVARHLLAGMRDKGQVDVVAEFTGPFPIMVIAELLGVDPADRDLFKTWSNGIMATAADDFESLLANYELIFDYFRRIVDARRSEPTDDMVSALVHAEVEGERLTDDEVLGFCALLLIAGNETTTNLLGNFTAVLAAHPDARAELVADPSLLPGAIEEVLRFEGPVPTLTRTAMRDIEIRDQTIPAGDKVLMLLAAANRDPRVFDDPETFDIHRTGSKHLEFGTGIHFCMGAALARLEARVATEELLTMYPDYTVATDAITYFNTPSIRGPVELPVALG